MLSPSHLLALTPEPAPSSVPFMFTDLGIVHGKEKEQKEARRGPEAGINVLISPPSKGGLLCCNLLEQPCR